MKKELKVIALLYLGVAVLTYAFTLRIDRLESVKDREVKNESIVLKIK